jgi:dual specificity phosphatase 12
MDQIIPGLWIGDLACALATDYLSIAGITHIVTAMKQRLPTPIVLPDGRTIDDVHVFHVNIDDVEGAPLLVHMPGAVEFIDEALKQEWLEDSVLADQEQEGGQEGSKKVEPPPGRGPGQWATMGEGTVLVHCHAGISRSVALVAAYLMNTRGVTRDEAIALIQSRRKQADPNPGFRHQLELYESGNYSVDVRNQRIRRFLMSQFSILRGDPIDDVMLSYFPSPLHSPSNSSSAGSMHGGLGGSLQISTMYDESASCPASTTQSPRSRRGSIPSNGGTVLGSLTMSRQNSRRAISIAAAKGGSERHERRRSRSEGMMDFGTLRALTKPPNADGTASAEDAVVDLSKSPPMPEQSIDLFDADDHDGSSNHRDEMTQALIQRSFSSVKEPHEVMITISSNNLPGGVKSLRGNQTQRSNTSSAAKATQSSSRLPKPHFVGTKLRCRMCRRELAAQDHVVEHEPGKGKDAFDVRKREKDADQKSRDGRAALGHEAQGKRDDGRGMTMEERFGAKGRSRVDDMQDQGGEEHQQSPTSQSAQPSAYKSAASLSAQLPPHLAALRLGRSAKPVVTADQVGSADIASSDNTAGSRIIEANKSEGMRKLLHSSACSSYFVEPLAWMAALQLGEVAGRLDCPNVRCAAKLGSWDWAGMQCAW